MTKAEIIYRLHSERCSIEEIAAAVGLTRKQIVEQVGVDEKSRRRPGPKRGYRHGSAKK